MGKTRGYLGVGLAASAVPLGLIVAPPAAAECTSSGGSTVCAQGSVRGADGPPMSTGPYYPYPCEYDWLCDDGGLSIIVNPGPPDIGRPGRPGGGGGGIGPR